MCDGCATRRLKLLGSDVLEAHGFTQVPGGEYARRDAFGAHRIALTADGRFRHSVDRMPHYQGPVHVLEVHLSHLDGQLAGERPLRQISHEAGSRHFDAIRSLVEG